MSREMLNLKEAAAHVHLTENELRHYAQRGEVEAVGRGEDWYFSHRVLDEWAQRNFLAVGPREQLRQHRVMVAEDQRAGVSALWVADYVRLSGISLSLAGKTKTGVLRDMTDLAVQTGLVYEPEALFRELQAREAVASTAVGEGAAFLHPRFHDPYLFEETFVAYGRAEHPVFFGAPNDEPTRHFFLICSTDHELHLHLLARLAVMAHATEFLSILDESTSMEQALSVIRAAEGGFLA